MAMALDKPKDTDDVFDIDGFTYIVDKEFIKKAQPVRVDFIQYGFKLSSSLVFENKCGGCSTTGNCG